MRIGIDLGGTKIEGLALDGDGAERARLRVATPNTAYEDTLQAIVDLVAELEKRVGMQCPVGIGHPGAVSPATGLIKNANSTRLKANRCMPIWSAGWGARCGCRTTPTAWRSRKP